MYFKQFFDEKLAQYAYLIGCQATGEAIIIDPMRDVDQYIEAAEAQNLNITAAADTHIHADFVSGLRELAEQNVRVYASDEGDSDWKYEWLKGSDYDYQLLNDGDEIRIGNITLKAWHTPGHTPEHLSYFVTDGATASEPLGVATGDFVFVGDVGRPDLLESAAGHKDVMKPAAERLYKSVEAFRDVPEYVQVWPGHGAGSACGKAMSAVPDSTVGYELRYNDSIKAATSQKSFVGHILEGQPEPPLYFARMKRLNKEGPTVLGKLPEPEQMSLEDMIGQNGVIIDTRDRRTFMQGHIPGSLLAPLDNNFNTVAGSYIDPEADIYLLVDEEDIEQAVRDLIRVGLDNIKGYVPLSDIDSYNQELERVEAISFDDLEQRREETNATVLDVRKATEYEDGHVPRAINIAHTRLADHLDELPRDKTLLVHCGSGQRASYATGLLIRNGFDVEWVDDEFTGWAEKYSDKVVQ